MNSILRYIISVSYTHLDVYKRQVQERVIKQALRITKTIAEDSYKNNTYGVEEKNKLPDFSFKVYLVSDLINAGLSVDQNGTYDYKRFFDKNPEAAISLARRIDEEAHDKDKDLTTIHASQNENADYWFATTTMLPYGRYVIVEQQPLNMPNKQYEISYPIEAVSYTHLGYDKVTVLI